MDKEDVENGVIIKIQDGMLIVENVFAIMDGKTMEKEGAESGAHLILIGKKNGQNVYAKKIGKMMVQVDVLETALTILDGNSSGKNVFALMDGKMMEKEDAKINGGDIFIKINFYLR